MLFLLLMTLSYVYVNGVTFIVTSTTPICLEVEGGAEYYI